MWILKLCKWQEIMGRKMKTNKYQKHVAYSYGCKLVSVNNKFSKRFKLYLREDDVYNFMDSLIEESKYCSEVMKKMKNILKKEHVTEKYRGAAHRDCNNNVKLNNKDTIVFHNLKNCDSHLIM